MPLVGLVDGERVTGPLVTADEWRELARRAKKGELVVTLPGCGQPAYPRHSRTGTQHFAHKPGVTCETHTGPETREHVLAKTIILKAALAAGWEAEAEHPGPGGWVADVWARRGSQQVALEVQWSKQNAAGYTDRQLRYAGDGVRAAWFARHPDSVPRTPSRGLPIFLLTKTADVDFTVTIGDVTVPLAEGVDLLLDGKVSFRDHLGGSPQATRRIELVVCDCWSCGLPTTIWLDGGSFGECACGLRRTPAEDFLESVGEYQLWQEHDRREASRDVRRAAAETAGRAGLPGLAALGRRHSKTTNSDYWAFSCPNCGALYGDYFLRDWLMERAYQAPDAVASLPGTPPLHPHWCAVR